MSPVEKYVPALHESPVSEHRPRKHRGDVVVHAIRRREQVGQDARLPDGLADGHEQADRMGVGVIRPDRLGQPMGGVVAAGHELALRVLRVGDDAVELDVGGVDSLA